MEATKEPLISEIDSDATTVTFFTVSVAKFVIMSIFTLGLYEVYWFYKNWGHIKNHQVLNIMPFWRALFAPLWACSAFNHIQNITMEEKLNVSVYAGVLAAIYFIMQVIGLRLPDPYWYITFFSFLLLLPANNALTLINQKTDVNFKQNGAIRGWNWLAVILGLPAVILIVLGFFLPQIE